MQYLLVLFLCLLAFPTAGFSQENTGVSSDDERTITGTVVSSTRNTIVVRTEDGRYQLFVFDRDTVKPRTVAAGSSVRIASVPGSQAGVRLTRRVNVVSAPAAGAAAATPAEADAIPPSVRRLEREIERSARRYGLGVRAGAALDPEILLVGLHANMGSIFTRSISLRPNIEFGFGEVTRLFAINPEALYRLPFSPAGGRWSAYLGAGPSFAFVDQNFERAAQGDRDIDFNDFDFKAGLNVLSGVEFRNGMFLEAKTTVYASPHLRLIVGYSF